VYSDIKIIGGITPGNNCIIAANAIVNKDIPENSSVAGIPDKAIKKIAHIEIARIRKR
jgi:acetyltransferase-like isoleucine patch superfamily enzyme